MGFRVAALLLAAGLSRRMGTSKQLLPFGNKTVIRHCVDTLVGSGIEDLVVVIGTRHGACVEALRGTPARIVRNDVACSQMADSVRTGLGSLAAACSGVLVCLADQPLVRTETCRTIVSLHHQAPGQIIIPTFKGKRGHPSLFPIEVIGDILFKGSLRDIVREDNSRVLLVEVPDDGVVLDMDTESDYQTIVGRYDASRSRL